MLHINLVPQDTLLEGETYQDIFEELHDGFFSPENEDLRSFVERYIKLIQKLVGKDIVIANFSYEAVAKELICVGIFEEVQA